MAPSLNPPAGSSYYVSGQRRYSWGSRSSFVFFLGPRTACACARPTSSPVAGHGQRRAAGFAPWPAQMPQADEYQHRSPGILWSQPWCSSPCGLCHHNPDEAEARARPQSFQAWRLPALPSRAHRSCGLFTCNYREGGSLAACRQPRLSSRTSARCTWPRSMCWPTWRCSSPPSRASVKPQNHSC